MKKAILLIFISTFCFSVFAQDSFFPLKEGTVMAYKTYDKKGKEISGSRITIKKVQGSGDNLTITYLSESLDAKDNLIFKDEISIVQKGNVMYMDMGNYLNKAAFQQNGEIPAEIKVTGNSMELPLNAQAGTVLPDASVTMEMKMGFLNMKMTANVTDRKVEGWEDVSVKAGNFNCCKFSSNVSAKIIAINVNTKSTDWYAKGVGIVKTESYDKKGDIESRMELVEFKQ